MTMIGLETDSVETKQNQIIYNNFRSTPAGNGSLLASRLGLLIKNWQTGQHNVVNSMMVKCVNELDNKLDILILRILLKCTVMTHDILKKEKKGEKNAF